MTKGVIFVALQFGLIAILIWENGWIGLVLTDMIFHFTGIALGLWAIFTMRESKLNVFPELRQEAKLISKGPYKRIRHPMYSAVLLYFMPFAINSIESALSYCCLMATLVLKLNYEENLLSRAFPNYSAYRQKTHRLIPFIY
jgi:protein-S-isoprenylcysteine O-methyltransferase Ste14